MKKLLLSLAAIVCAATTMFAADTRTVITNVSYTANFTERFAMGDAWNDATKYAITNGWTPGETNYWNPAPYMSKLYQWDEATSSMVEVADNALIIEGKAQYQVMIMMQDATNYRFPASAADMTVTIDGKAWIVTALNTTDTESWVTAMSPEFDVYIVHERVNGIIYSLKLSNHSAMVMPATAFDAATGDEIYEGNVTIPETVTYKGQTYNVNTLFDGVFASAAANTKLLSVTLPATIKSMGLNLFENATALKTFTCLATAVPAAENGTFDGLDVEKTKVLVPVEAVDAYRLDPVWKKILPVYDEIDIDGILYMVDPVVGTAMMMPAFSYEGATGDERYSGAIVVPPTITYKGQEYPVASVYVGAFWECPALTSVTLGANIKEILGDAVFLDSPNMATLICNALVPPSVAADAFNGLKAGVIPQVPAAALDAYKAHAVWGKLWTTTGIEDASQKSKVESQKMFRNGQLLIEHDGKIYNAVGAEVK